MENFEAMIAFMLLYICYLHVMRINRKVKRQYWVRPVNLTREIDGYFETCFTKIKLSDPEDFFKHTRMTPNVYNLLLQLVHESLTKSSIRKPLSAECRLAITLSFLSQGVPYQYLAWSFKVGKSTIRKVLYETCDVLWNVLSPVYVSTPNECDFKLIANDFETKWDLPNCVGAVDGKHIRIKRPAKSGTDYYNYKKFFSIVLLAICDARYIFTYIDVGAYGSQSDGGILRNSKFGKLLLSGQLAFPKDSNLPNSNVKFPYFVVGDPAFALCKHLMKPFSKHNSSREKRIFNYRISRARVVIENCFGILVARWRVLQSSLCCNPTNSEKIVLATIALHNFIKLNESANQYCPPHYVDWEDADGNVQPGEWRNGCTSTRNVDRFGSRNACRNDFALRETLMKYLNNEGAIEKQRRIE